MGVLGWRYSGWGCQGGDVKGGGGIREEVWGCVCV